MLSLKFNGPCDTPVNPEQLMNVGVTVGVLVGRGVRDGVNVKVGGCVFAGDMYGLGVFVSKGGRCVNVGVQGLVGV